MPFDRQATQSGMGAVEPAFDGLTYIAEQVPAIGDLLQAEISEKQARSIRYQMTIEGPMRS